MNRTHALTRLRSTPRTGRLLLGLMFSLLVAAVAAAQDNNTSNSTPLSVDDTAEIPAPTAQASPSPAPTTAAPTTATPIGAVTPSPATTSPPPRAFGRTIVLVLGGVSWRDWLSLATQSSTATPGLRRVLEEGALGAAFLPGAKIKNKDTRTSPAMLRAAIRLSSGEADSQALRNPPEAAAYTLGLREWLGASTPGYEEGEAAVAFARRTDRAPQPGNLVNLGWGALLQALPSSRGEEREYSIGALADAVHLAGGQTAALGSGDTTVLLQQSTPLREWALVACDANGTTDAGNVSSLLLARDKAAPFGLRANRKAYLQTLDTIFGSGQTALVAVEWGDTRRAAEYSARCAPEVAAAHRQAALRSADAFIQAVIGGVMPPPSTTDITGGSTPAAPRLNAPRDRLLVIAIPDLRGDTSQWLPVAYWRPARGGQGALLEKTRGSEGIGAIGLENLYARLTLPLGVEGQSTHVASLHESGGPVSATNRIARLVALQSGVAWLESARAFGQALWCALFILSCGWTLWVLRHGMSTIAAKWARGCWVATMILPWLLWLGGLCVETTWRFGESGPNWKLSLALVAVACVAWFLIGATFNWFGDRKMQRIRLGVIWLLLSILGLKIGGFVLPWNALLHFAPLDASTPALRSGEMWSLLFVSATLLALSGLTKARAAQSAGGEARRVLNLRPALMWAVAVVVILWLPAWGRDAAGATIALLACGAMWLRLWLERAPREVRLRNRRIVLGIAVVAVLLLWQRNSFTGWQGSFALWNEAWQATWHNAWWDGALFAFLCLLFAFTFTGARDVLRTYLTPRYSLRAMLGATALASVAGLLIYGPAAPPLLATFTLGALAYEVLGRSEKRPSPGSQTRMGA